MASLAAESIKDRLSFAVLGRSGCGKGTQAGNILERLGKEPVHHMETGRFLREVLEINNPTTNLGREVMERGDLFPEWFVIFTWLRELIEKGHADAHLVFDGAPRRLWEARLLDEVLKWHHRPLPICIYIDLSPKESTKRMLLRGRADDNLAAIRNRLKYFPKFVLPVIRYYKSKGRLIRVNGSGNPEEVWEQIGTALRKRLKKRWPAK